MSQSFNSNDFTLGTNDRNIIITANNREAQKLTNILNRYYETEIKNKPNFANIKKRLSPTLESITIEYMKNAYKKAGQYAILKLKLKDKIPFYNISPEEDQLIINESRIILDKFWSYVEKIENRNNPNLRDDTVKAIDLNTDKDKPLDPLEYSVYLGGTARMMVFTAFNMGVTNSPKQIIALIRASASGIELGNVNEEDFFNNYAFRFLTRNDNRVDPVMCLPLKNKIFPVSSTAIPLPPLHRHCRCVLVLVTRKKKV